MRNQSTEQLSGLSQAAAEYMSDAVFKYQDSDFKPCAVYHLVWNTAHLIVDIK